MKFQVGSSIPKVDVLFLPLFKGEKLTKEMAASLGKDVMDEIDGHHKNKVFEGESGNLHLFPKGKSFKRVVLIGRGERDKKMPNALEQLGGQIAGLAKGCKASSIAVLVAEQELSEMSYGIALGNYSFDHYKKTDKKNPPVKLKDVHMISEKNKTTQMTIDRVNIFTEASALTRDMINKPTADLHTDDLANHAKQIGAKFDMKVTVFDDKKLQKIGCGSIYGVGKGAVVGSRMVFLEYKYKSKATQPNIAFIGKGIVFDTGGLNLKPTGYIETMKEDMAGAATVLGAMQAIAEAKVPGYFLAVLCCAENAISDKAQRPGDVVTAYNGKTIEITNTDAEGRLVLADGLAYTEKHYKPKLMIDIATLTGAVTVALGFNITGVMGNDEQFIDEILDASRSQHERMWPLPLDEDFVEATKGDFTDLKNSSDNVRAGSTMGAAFLKSFVDKTPWLHIDFAGTAWANKPTSTTKYGATGAMLRTLIEMAVRHQG